MRKTLSPVASAVIAALLGAAPVRAEGWRDHLVPLLSERSRAEFVDWFRPRAGTAPPGAERYDFFASQLRAGVRATFPHAQVTLELQDTRLVGLPDDASLPAPQGNLGPGATYYAHTRATDQGETILKQAFLAVRWRGVQGTLGRFDYGEGLETTPGDPTLVWLKRARLAERLVGAFGYTHVARGFDGLRLGMDRPAWNASAIAAHPTAGGFEVSANHELGEIDLAGLALTAKGLAAAAPWDARGFYFYYHDTRGDDGRPLKVDNRPAPVRAADRGALRLHTMGGHAIAALDAGGLRLDGLSWGAWQSGAWGALAHRAWTAALEAGVQAPRLPAAPWLRAGVDLGSGDDDPGDGLHRTFFQLLPTARVYAQLPFYNGMNIEDRFVQVVVRPHPVVTVRSDFHELRLREARDLWYAGGGATREDVFGYSGISSSGRRDLARVTDLSVTAVVHRRLTLYGYYGHAFGRGVVRGTFEGDDADYGYLESTFRW
jgi:alginate export protein